MSNSLRKKELVKEIYRLGFSVGYHKHFEMGRVLQRYNSLLDKADEYGVEDSVKDYYNKGKVNGERKRMLDLASGLSKETLSKEKPKESYDLGDFESKQNDNKTPEVENKTYAPTQKPKLTSLPTSIERAEAIGLPSFLELFHKSTRKEK